MIPNDPAPYLRVGEEKAHWSEGKMTVFDDSFEHEVVHTSNKTRVVLIIDIQHPELSEDRAQWYHDNLEAVQGPNGLIYSIKNQASNDNVPNREELWIY